MIETFIVAFGLAFMWHCRNSFGGFAFGVFLVIVGTGVFDHHSRYAEKKHQESIHNADRLP